MEVRKINVDIVYEHEFFSDVFNSNLVVMMRWWHGWPDATALSAKLSGLKKFSVSYSELEKTGLFPTQDSTMAFLRFYSKFDFCEPPTVRHGRVEAGPLQYVRHQAHIQKEEFLADKLEARLARLFNLKIPTYKDLAHRLPTEDISQVQSMERLGSFRSRTVTTPSPLHPT